MPFIHNHNDNGVTESFETFRILDHDDVEDTLSVAEPTTDSDIPAFLSHAGLGDVRHLPVSPSYLVHGVFLLADSCHPRCRASDAPAAPSAASNSGCSPESIALVAISPARLRKVRELFTKEMKHGLTLRQRGNEMGPGQIFGNSSGTSCDEGNCICFRL